MPYYLNPSNAGISQVGALGDGYSITIKWNRAFVKTAGNRIAYNIYVGTEIPIFESEFFNQSPSFVCIDGSISTTIIDLTPGQIYRFAVRAVEYDLSIFDFTSLPPAYNNLRLYPESPLREDITATSTIIPLLDVENFPSTGVVKIGVEMVQYTSIDTAANNLVLTSTSLQRGFNNTSATLHTVDGYDGYATYSSTVLFFPVDLEDRNTVIFATQDRFDYDHYAFNLVDGYRQNIKDIVNTDLSVSDEMNAGFPAYSFAGYRRIDPVALLNGECVGSYFGGQRYCADGYNGVGQMLRGLSVDDANTQRQEVLLSLIGEPVVLVKRVWTGIYCFCMRSTQEMPDARCPTCAGSGRVLGWSQYFDSRNSDGRIRMRFDPWVDDLPATDAGLDPEATKPNAWTLVIPAIKKRDFIVRFDADGNEEFRYEAINVGRNMLFGGALGAQKISLQRIRHTDSLYSIKVFRDTSTMPAIISTSINSSLGIAPHSHTVVRSEKSPTLWHQITSVSQGHSHTLDFDASSGTLQISQELSHSHTLIY